MAYKYIFGPVPSRRLGVSLGLDIVKFKTCNLNCVYCECGATTNLTNERAEYVPTEDIIAELKEYLSTDPYLDYITFAGSGEPMLHSEIGKIIEAIKELTDTKVALITNGTLLDDKEIFKEIEKVDVLIPSLDAVSEEVFNKINRPVAVLDLEKIKEGLRNIKKYFKGEVFLEIFIIDGINTDKSELDAMKDEILKINPDKVQLNTLDRPPVENWVKPASMEVLQSIVKYWDLPNVEIVKKYKSREMIKGYSEISEKMILTTIINRPCTIEDLEEILQKDRSEINKYLDILEKEKLIKTTLGERGIFIQKNK